VSYDNDPYKMLPVIVLSLLFAASVTDAGVSYVRWGRTTCPTGSFALYKGYMAGGYYAVTGGGSNFMCMIDKPKFVRPVAGRQGSSGFILGVELDNWQNQYPSLFSTENLNGGEVNNQNMPCVRCYVEGSSDQMVLPGVPDCASSGYDLQYKGFLVSGYHTHPGRTSYVCMDEAPEGITGGQGNNDQSIVYPVEIACGSLPCNPYVDGYEATCAVCSY